GSNPAAPIEIKTLKPNPLQDLAFSVKGFDFLVYRTGLLWGTFRHPITCRTCAAKTLASWVD
ncbi:MAG: hypothetical protein AAF827_22585, partial [Cyanobacteria bacterium P01_D01_bin.6]